MAAASLSFVIGIIGNIISAMVFASPIPTFWGVVKKKSTEKYEGLPYIITLLSTSLWSFYAFLKPGGFLILTVNGLGAFFQFIYVSLFLIYSPKDKKMGIAKLVVILNVCFLGAMIALTLLAVREEVKLNFIGLVCTAFTIGMYASPLSVMGMVIKTKSVEYMPFLLSFFLFISAGIWSFYSLLVQDIYMGVANVTGIALGLLQLIIYLKYKNKSKPIKSVVIKIEEEASTTVQVKAEDIEMGTSCDGVDTKNNIDESDLKEKAPYQRVESLPKPILTRICSMPKTVTNTLSFNSNEVMTCSCSDDVSKGKENKH